MLRFSKIFVFFIMLMMLLSVTVFASEIDMNLVSDETGENSVNINTSIDGTISNDTLPASTSGDIGGSAAPSGVSSIAQENMSFSNILNIFVIAVGVIIILLAIAILIRLK